MTTGHGPLEGIESDAPKHETIAPDAIAGLIDGIDGLTAPEDIKAILTEMFGFMIDHHRECHCMREAEERWKQRQQ